MKPAGPRPSKRSADSHVREIIVGRDTRTRLSALRKIAAARDDFDRYCRNQYQYNPTTDGHG